MKSRFLVARVRESSRGPPTVPTCPTGRRAPARWPRRH